MTELTLHAALGLELQDPDEAVFTEALKIAFINDAITYIVGLRPDINLVTEPFTIWGGEAKQYLPDTDMQLVEVYGNSSAYLPQTNFHTIAQIDRNLLNRFDPLWETPKENVTLIKHVIFDLKNPGIFYVYPVPDSLTNLIVEIVYKKAIVKYTAELPVIGIPEKWLIPIKDYVLYKCFNMNSPRNDQTRATQHYSYFAAALKGYQDTDTMVNQVVEDQENK